MSIILIGDVAQLPSIGAGNVLKDIIESHIFPVVELKKVYRQAKGSKIIINSHMINAGEFPDLSKSQNSDFFFIEEKDLQKVLNLICDLCEKRLPQAYNFDPIHDIQVITPMNKGDLGAQNINKILQSVLNKNITFLSQCGAQYFLGDKVMQTKNNYEKDVFNGDIGIVNQIRTNDKKLTVNFDGKYVDYDALDLDELVLSYAITVHKSQGGEFPAVIMPISMKHRIMLQRNLLYTAITRAPKIIILIGEKQAVKYAIANNNIENRNTLLQMRLRDRFGL